jgi:hypothetical protein
MMKLFAVCRMDECNAAKVWMEVTCTYACLRYQQKRKDGAGRDGTGRDGASRA